MSSIAQANKIIDLENRIAAIEAVFLRPTDGGCKVDCNCKPDMEKMKNDIQGLKMRMGKRDG
jgi:hypothetical protein